MPCHTKMQKSKKKKKKKTFKCSHKTKKTKKKKKKKKKKKSLYLELSHQDFGSFPTLNLVYHNQYTIFTRQ